MAKHNRLYGIEILKALLKEKTEQLAEARKAYRNKHPEGKGHGQREIQDLLDEIEALRETIREKRWLG